MTEPIDPDPRARLDALLVAIGETEASQLRVAILNLRRATPEPPALEHVVQERAAVLVGKLAEAGVTSWADLTVALAALFRAHMQLEQARRAQEPDTIRGSF